MKRTINILVVDDDAQVRETLSTILSGVGYEVICADSGAAMFDALKKHNVALVILDLVLPGEYGLTIAKELREHSSIPLIMITGKGDETDKILSLEIAADDFIMKPFNMRELLARVRSLLRRTTELSTPLAQGGESAFGTRLEFSGWIANVETRELRNGDNELVSLTFGEFSLLETFLRNPNKILNRDQLIEKSRRYSTDVFDRTIDVLILRLRRKIEVNPSKPSLILTERNLGYIFKANVVQC